MNKTILWFCALGIVLSIIWLFGSIITPFVISFLLAYILHPLVNKITSKCSINKAVVAIFIAVCFTAVAVLLLTLIVPLIYEQVSLLISQLPVYKTYIQGNIIPLLTDKMRYISPDITMRIQSILQGAINNMLGIVASTVNNILDYTMATIGMMFTILLIPIILFYFLRDWPSQTLPFEDLIPNGWLKITKTTLSKIDNLLSAYIVGQSNVCFLMALYYSVGLSVVGLNIGVLLGIISGLTIIIPFVGFLLSFGSALIIGYISFGVGHEILYIAILYITGSVIEGSILTPKIIGDKIGLHPLWIIFSVLAGGHLFGIVGLLFAIPAAGVCKILFALAIERIHFQ